MDPARGWVIALCWLLACGAECVVSLTVFITLLTACEPSSIYYILFLVRRPRLVLDFALTLLFNHILLTTYYAASIPSSLFYWGVVGAGAPICAV